VTDYRVNVLSGEAAASGNVHLDVHVEKEVAPDEWSLIPLGHRTMVLNGAAVLAITTGSGTLTQKRAALLALFRQEVLSWGLDESDDAYTQLEELLPSGFPVTVDL
jgi:hypothetical protein